MKNTKYHYHRCQELCDVKWHFMDADLFLKDYRKSKPNNTKKKLSLQFTIEIPDTFRLCSEIKKLFFLSHIDSMSLICSQCVEIEEC